MVFVNGQQIALGIRGDLCADGEKCWSCGLLLCGSPRIERLRAPVEDHDGRLTSTEIEFVVGTCWCSYRWALLWATT